MTKAKKIIASLYVLTVFGLLAHDALKPQDVKNISGSMIYNYSVVESYNSIDYAVEYLSSKNGATTSTAVGTDEYFSANSHLLALASQTRQEDKEQELLDRITAEVKQSEAEDAILAKVTEEVKQAEIAEQEAEKQRKAKEAAEAAAEAKKAEISSQIQSIDSTNFYIEDIIINNGSRVLHMDYDHQAYLYKICQDKGIDYLTAFSVIIVESSCNNNIPSKGYYGYFQMNDGCVKNVRNYYGNQSLDPTNPYDNILIGVTLLKDQVEQTGNLYDGLLAYNKGYYGWLNNRSDTAYADTVMSYRDELLLLK